MQRLAVLVAALSFASSAPAEPDAAADYPNHPVRIIVSTSAGGGVDTVTRIIAAQLQEKLGQPFVVEDRGGGGGNIGAEAVYTAEPDGYTLLASQPRACHHLKTAPSLEGRPTLLVRADELIEFDGASSSRSSVARWRGRWRRARSSRGCR